MKKNFVDLAEKINQAYHVKSNCFNEKGQLKNYAFVIFYDDDITSALEGAKAWHELNLLYGPYCNGVLRKCICVGGKGLLSKFLYKESEARHLANVAIALGVPENCIIIADKGTNTTENFIAIKKLIGTELSLVCITDRLAAIFEQSRLLQFPELKIDCFVIQQSVKETLQLYNGFALANGAVALHFWAHVVRRFDENNGKFLIKPFEPSKDVREAASTLEKRFLIKQRINSLRKYFQYIPILVDLLIKKSAIAKAEKQAIEQAKKDLKAK